MYVTILSGSVYNCVELCSECYELAVLNFSSVKKNVCDGIFQEKSGIH